MAGPWHLALDGTVTIEVEGNEKANADLGQLSKAIDGVIRAGGDRNYRRYKLTETIDVEVSLIQRKLEITLFERGGLPLQRVIATAPEIVFTRLAMLRSVIELVECGAIEVLPERSPWA